jgi:hypothetical protein
MGLGRRKKIIKSTLVKFKLKRNKKGLKTQLLFLWRRKTVTEKKNIIIILCHSDKRRETLTFTQRTLHLNLKKLYSSARWCDVLKFSLSFVTDSFIVERHILTRFFGILFAVNSFLSQFSVFCFLNAQRWEGELKSKRLPPLHFSTVSIYHSVTLHCFAISPKYGNPMLEWGSTLTHSPIDPSHHA